MYHYLEPVHSSRAPVALESEVILRVDGVHILDCHPPLNAPQCKTGWSVLLVFENGHTAMLILEWALHLFELPGLPVQLVDHDAPASSPHHSHGVLHIRAVGTLWQVDAEHWSGCSGVPELHRLVPGDGHEGRIVGCLDPATGFHRSLVLGNLDCLVAPKVPAFHLLWQTVDQFYEPQYEHTPACRTKP